MVIKAQMKVLDLVRKGVQISILEGVPIDEYPGRANLSPTSEEGWEVVKERGSSVPAETLEDAMARVSVVNYADKENPEVNLDACYKLGDLQPEFKPDEDGDAKVAEYQPGDQIDLFGEVDNVSVTSEEDEASGRGSADETYDAAERDVDLFPGFVVLGTGAGKIHKPATLKAGDTNPACCIKGRHFSCLRLDEAWGESYSLCVRCFSKQGDCEMMCEHTAMIKGELHRCGRRCAGVHETENECQDVSHACSFHAPV